MRATTRRAAIALVLLLQGCKGTSTGSTGGNSVGAAPISGVPEAGTQDTKVVYIADPTLNNMNAASVKIPARWVFQGMLFQGGTCTPIPNPVYRASSPDGLSYVEALPLMGWKWISGPLSNYAAKDDCLQIQSPMSAQQFLRYIAPMLNANYVQDEPVPQQLVAQAQQNLRAASGGGGNSQTTRELARAIVTLNNGTFTLQGRLGTMVDCTATVFPGQKSYLRGIADTPSSTVNKCTAAVYLYAAPQNQYADMIATWDTPGMGATELADWAQAWVHRNQQQTMKTINQISAQGEKNRDAIREQYQHNMEVQQRMHEQFLQSMQESTNRSMQRVSASMASRSATTSDIVDYALDRRTIVDQTTGGLVHVPNQAAVVWSNSQGQTFTSEDPTADPRGILPGNWSQQNFTHGNGAPM